MACHRNVAQIEVSDAAGLSASEVADEVIALTGSGIERSTAVEGFDHLYALVIDSFTFLPRPL